MDSFAGLLNNAALMLILCLFYDTFGVYAIAKNNLRYCCTGVLVGLIGIAVMLNPWSIQPGVFFDTRWVLLSLCGLFFGLFPTMIAVIITGSFRLYQGGPGGVVGTVVIVVTACVGLAWKYWQEKHDKPLGWKELYTFGFLVQLAMLSCMFLMPKEMQLPIIKAVAPPILIIFPLLTMVIGLILKRQKTRRDARKELLENRKSLIKERGLLRGVINSIPDLIFFKNTEGEYLGCNRSFESFVGFEEQSLLGKTDFDLFDKDTAEFFGRKDDEIFTSGKPVTNEEWVDYPDGKKVLWDTMKTQFKGLDGTLHGLVGISRDITDRMRAEEALKINEQRLQLAIEGADLGMWDWDMQTNDVYFSPRYLSMLGYGPMELPHTLATWDNLLHPEDRETVKQQIFSCIEKGSGKWGTEFRLRHKSGQYLWISGRGKIVEFSQNGSPIRAAGTHRDITYRKITEEELRVREERFRELFNNMGSAVAIYDAVEEGNNFIFKDLNRAGLLSSQLKLHEIVGKKVTKIFPAIKEMGLLDVFQRVYKTGIPEQFPSSFYQDDRITLWVENYVCKIPSGEIVAVYNDITVRKKAEAELVRSKEEWEKTFDAIPDIVTIQDKDFRIVRANKAATNFFRLEFGELIGQKCYEVFRGTHAPCPGCPGIITLEDINSHVGIIEHQSLKKIFQVSSSPLLGENCDVQYLIHMARDITEQKKMEEELLKGRKLESVGILAGGIAHDFNNILAAILGNISLALTNTDPKDEIYELLTESEKASLRAKDLTQQLLTFSKGGELVKKIAAIEEVIRDSAGFVLRGSNVRCDFKFNEGLWPVTIDSGQISQVIQNIIVNASQAMPTGGAIAIDCSNYRLDSSTV